MDPDPLPFISDYILQQPLSPSLGVLGAIPAKLVEFHAPDSWLFWLAIVIVALCCLVVSGFVSGSEIAYFGLSPQELDDLEEDEAPDAKRAFNLLKDTETLLATILITNNLVNITMVVLLSFAISQTVIFHSDLVSFLVQSVCLTFLLLIFGEIFPKLLARNKGLRWVLFSSRGIRFLCCLFKPLARVMTSSSGFITKVVSRKQETLTTDELEKALEISDLQEGKDKEMLEGILSFGNKEASEVMISRVDVTDIEYHASFEDAMKVILESGFSRIPVYDTSQDTIRGILYSKDLLPYIGKRDNSFRWQSLIREPYFVPESRMIDDLLEDFRSMKIHIAIVIDEYGGTSGIVTLEDIIEEIVGEIDDEYDDSKRLYRRIAPDTYIFEGKTTISDFCRVVGIEEAELGDIGESDTIAGLILEQKGDFPEKKESFRAGPCRFLVLDIEKHRITRLRVSVDKHDSDEQNGLER